MTQTESAALEQMESRINSTDPLDLRTLMQEQTLALSVDLNNGFAKHGALYSERVNALIPQTIEFAKGCRQQGIRVVALCDRHTDASPEFLGYPPHCMADTDEPLPVEELRGYLDDTLYKNSTNGFYRLAEQGLIEPYQNFIITGCCTDICIFQLATAVKTWFNERNDARRVIVPIHLVDTYDSPAHDARLLNAAFLCSMMDCGINVASDILF
ncbi:MAG: cysteine hydrolase family protein [Acetanaerobacterium sp.]